ncbi:hypothetical protein [Arthrobacter sp. AQ5-05]|uniref:hypothetical protein n=1 Tax=Arthrobacter sp. AQ5-05 TaxID=2184581 RepID=UPI0012B609AE|nr:hypothetical protein [Arthrobacter sp. AQ5-05]
MLDSRAWWLTGADSPIISSASALADLAIIIEVQKTQIQDFEGIPGTVLKQYSGTGPATLHIDPLPTGQKMLGATVICSGSEDWKLTIEQLDPGWAGSSCSLQCGSSMRFPLEDPAKGTTVTVDVASDANVWVTVFSTG